MPITYAGETLLLPEDEGGLDLWLDRFLPLEELHAYTRPAAVESGEFDGFLPNYPDPPRPRLNQLYWPTGATRWATFFGLADTTTKDAIVAAAGALNAGALLLRLDTGGEPFSSTEGSSPVDEVAGGPVVVKMWLLPPRPISARFTTDDETLWMIPLVDDRYYWQHASAAPDTTSWTTLKDDLADAVGITMPTSNGWETDNTDEADLGTPTPCVFRPYHNAAVMLEAALWSVGRRLLYAWPEIVTSTTIEDETWYQRTPDSLESLIDIVDGVPSQSFANGAFGAPSLGDRFDDQYPAGLIPATVRVVFPEETLSSTDAADYHTEDVTAASLGITKNNGTTKTLRTSFISTGSNATAVTDLATHLATLYYRGLARRRDVAFPGVHWFHEDWYTDCVVYDCEPQRSRTRVQSLPYNFGSERQASGDGTECEASGTGTPTIRFAVCEACCDECWADVTLLSKPKGATITGLGATVKACGDGQAFTVDSGTDVVTSAGHGHLNGDPVQLTTTDTLPDPLATGTTYYVINATTDTYQLAATAGGAAIDLTDTGTGTHTATEFKELADNQLRVYDKAGCFLNEPNDDLVSRVGYATFLDASIAENCAGSTYSEPCTGMPDEAWEITSLCCPADACA